MATAGGCTVNKQTRLAEELRKRFDLPMHLTDEYIVYHWGATLLGALISLNLTIGDFKTALLAAVPDDVDTRLESFLEVTVNVGSGFVVSYLYWVFVMSELLRGGTLTVDDGFMVTTHYTVLAVARGYLWRRFFANGVHRRIHAWIRGLS